jgi:hypothetical protein
MKSLLLWKEKLSITYWSVCAYLRVRACMHVVTRTRGRVRKVPGRTLPFLKFNLYILVFSDSKLDRTIAGFPRMSSALNFFMAEAYVSGSQTSHHAGFELTAHTQYSQCL